MKKLLLLLGLVIAGMAGGAYYIWLSATEPGPLAEATEVLVDKGATSGIVAKKLEKASVIRQAWLFRLVARAYGLDKRLKAGEYRFYAGIPMVKVISQMAAGEVFFRRLTLPEGLTTAQMEEIIRNEPYLSGELTITAAEGELLPETYSFTRGDSRNMLIRQAKKAMEKALDEAWKQQKNPYIKDKKELLILASIIEKETGVPQERPDIAAVFANRLKKGMKLQTDPTVIYALTGGEFVLGRPLYKKDLEIDNPYNTYRNYGLPPGPICNPGKEAIRAAANPSDSEYLFFVASGNGGHRFAKTLNEHNSNVDAYRKNLRNK